MCPTRLPVIWRLNYSSALPWHKVTSDGALVLLHVDHSAQGNYSCYDNQGFLLHSVKLRLGCKYLSRLTAANLGAITLLTALPYYESLAMTAALKNSSRSVFAARTGLCPRCFSPYMQRQLSSPSQFSSFFFDNSA